MSDNFVSRNISTVDPVDISTVYLSIYFYFDISLFV